MKFTRIMFCSALAIAIGCCCLLPLHRARAADDAVSVPAIIQDGFQVWTKKQNASYVFDVWKKGGLLEDNSKPESLSSYFARADRTVGNYKSFEVVDGKTISPSSKIVYLAINFERAAIYGRFLLYRTDKDWVIQNMDFSVRPEAVMQWLAFTGENYSQ
jgi:hypothetical protein